MKNLLQRIGKIPNNLKYFTYLLAGFSLLVIPTNEAYSQITYSISKSNNAPNPIQSGQPFTYTITYNWSGGAPGTLYITDNVPASLDVLSALPSSPTSTITGNLVTFAISGLSLPSGSGTVQINARFKPGITCGGIEACNVAGISDTRDGEPKFFTEKSCVTSAEPTMNWGFRKDVIAGCALDDEVIYRICITRPSGTDIGGVNLMIDSLQDLLPPNAEIINVTSNWSGPSGVVSTGSWINLTGGPTILPVSPYAGWYCTYVRVKFPSANFAVGQNVDNIAKLTYHTPCDTTRRTMIDTATVELCNGVSQGSLWKGLTLGIYFPNNPSWLPTFSPGCCGTYRLNYVNNGTLAQSNFEMEDIVPGHVDVNAIRTTVPVANVPVVVEVFTWSGGSCGTTPVATFTYTTPGLKTETTLPTDICRVKWSYGGSIAVNENLNNYLDVCVRTTNFKTGAAVLPGQTILNTVTAQATGLPLITVNHSKDVDTTKPNVVATKIFTGECTPGCQINPNGPFMPGDTVRYRMAVANIGTDDATLATITDVLPAGFSYVGNESYFYGAFNWMINPYNPSCCSFNATVPTEIGGSITTPTVGATTLNWSFPVLPSRCDGTVEYFLIEFDVVLSTSPPVLAGQHQNTFDFDASNSPVVTSNIAYMTVNAIAQLQSKKEVRLKGSGAAWANIADIPAGQTAEYRLSVKNTGNTPLTDLCLLDIAPWVGDITVLPPYSARNSQFDLPYNPADGAITITPAGFSSTYNTSTIGIQKNPSRASECGGFCGITDPVGALAGTWGAAATTYSYKVNANSGINLLAGATLEILVPATIPSGTAVNDTACNSFAIQTVPAGLPNVCLSTESNKACVVVKDKNEPDPCLIVDKARVVCKEIDDKGNQVYGLSMSLLSNVGYTTTIGLVSVNSTFYNIAPATLVSGLLTSVLADFTTSLVAGDTLCFTIELKDQKQNTVCKETVCVVIPDCKEDCLILERVEVDCKELDADGNQVYSLNMLLQSNVGYTTTIGLVSGNASFSNITPATLVSGSFTTILADFTTSASAGDTVCFVIELKDKEQRTVCKEEVCIVIPKCGDTGCECPFDINTKPIESGQIDGTSFFMSNGIYTSGASLKRVRATIISAVVTEDCDGQITTYNSGAVFQSASPWLTNNATGLGTSSVTWNSKDCDPLDEFLPDYKLDIPFTSAEKCRLKVKLCIRYEFLDCKCNHCETVLCTEIDVKNPVSGVAREDGLSKRTISSNVYPNPISSLLNIDYNLKQSSTVSIVIRDLTGKAVATLVNSEQKIAGDYTISMETFNLPAGVYLYTIETETESHTNRFVIKK